MRRLLQELRRFIGELKRRNVYKVAATYLVVAFVALQAVNLLVPSTTLPAWADELVLTILIVGFPVSLVVAWAFELTPEGVRRTESVAPEDRVGRVEREGAPPPDTAEARRPKRSTAVLLGATAAALVVVTAWWLGEREVFGGGDVFERPAASPSGPASSTVAVLPFSVEGSPDLAYLGEGMVNLVATKLDGAGDLRTVDPRALLRVAESEGIAPGDSRSAESLAHRFGAALYLVGDLVEVGGRIQLSAALHRTGDGDAGTLSEGTVSGRVENLFTLVDELTAQLLSGLSGGPAARVKRIAAVTTSSLPALKSFLEGETLFRRAQFDAAVEAFQHAVEADSLFALAHYRLGLAAEWNLQDGLAREAAEEAARLAGRLSDRDRRMLEAFRVRRRGANAEAEKLYRSILGTYPNAMEAWLDLGEVLFHANPLRGRSFTESKEALYRVLGFDPQHATALIHLARIAAYEGDHAELDSLVLRFMALDPAPERRMEIEALRAFALGDSSAVEDIVRRLKGAEDLGVALAVWAVGVYARDLDGAERLARLLAVPHRSAEARRLAYAWLAHLELARGRWSAARRRLSDLRGLSEGIALEYRALLCSIPFVPSSGCDPSELAVALERLDPTTIPGSENPSVVFTAHDSLHPFIRHYLLGLTRARLGHAAAARRSGAALLEVDLPRTAGSLAEDLARSVDARLLIDRGRDAEALAKLEAARMETWYGQTLASPLYSRVLERFVQAELLRKLGREEAALDWYASLVETSPFELPYLAMSHLKRAGIHDGRGETKRAVEHYSRFLRLWSDAGPEFQDRVEDARRRLRSLRGHGSADPDAGRGRPAR